MLVSIVFVISPRRKTALPFTLGSAVHACFLNLVARMDGRLAERLHADEREKPFTVSPLQGDFTTDGQRVWVQPEREYWLKFTSLEPCLSQLLLSLEAGAVRQITLCGAEFEVLKVCTNEEEHRWAGRTTYADLYRGWIVTGEPAPRKLCLRFFSPTTFRLGRRNLPFPIPRLVFFTLAEKWNRYAPVHLGDEVAASIAEMVSLARYELRTQILDFGRYRQVGFVGDCEFLVHTSTKGDDQARVISLLAEFGFYAGVGYKTTMGMGQVRGIEERRWDQSLSRQPMSRRGRPEPECMTCIEG